MKYSFSAIIANKPELTQTFYFGGERCEFSIKSNSPIPDEEVWKTAFKHASMIKLKPDTCLVALKLDSVTTE